MPEDHPVLPSRARPKRDALRARAKAAEAEHARPTEVTGGKQPGGKPAETADAKAAKTAATQAKMAAKGLTDAGSAKPAKNGDTMVSKTAGRDDGAKVDSKDVRFGNMCLVAPKNWMRERPPMGFIMAQFSLPRAAGDKADAQLTITSPGEHDPKAVERVREQLKEKPEEGSMERLQIAGNEVVLVDSTGDYGDDSDEDDKSSPPPANQGRYRALNAMVFLGGKVYVINCTGPEKTVSERASEFRAFLQTMKPADKP
jgi:hypothetical protein